MSNDRDRLIKALKEILPTRGMAGGIPIIQKWDYGATADKLLEKGVILPPCKVGDKVYTSETRRVKEWVRRLDTAVVNSIISKFNGSNGEEIINMIKLLENPDERGEINAD